MATDGSACAGEEAKQRGTAAQSTRNAVRTCARAARRCSNMLPAVDVQLGAGHVGTGVGAEEVDRLGDLSGVPRRCRGICSTILSVPGERIAVSISPGEMALTRTPSGPKSRAISRVSEASAALEVAYAAPAKGCTFVPAIEVTLTTDPF